MKHCHEPVMPCSLERVAIITNAMDVKNQVHPKQYQNY